MRVLVACEFSGTVRDAFIAKGHDAWSCDLLPTDKPGPHIQGDVLEILDAEWDMMIAHPPCTYLCGGGNNWLNRRPDLKWRENRVIAFEFFMALYNAPIPKVCVENPIGVVSSMFRPPNQIVHPYWFGHDVRKDTCLWLRGLPPLFCTITVPPPHRKVDFWSNKRNPNGRSIKSITYDGIAKAMADQWGTL